MEPLDRRTHNDIVPKVEPSSLLSSNNDDVMPGSAFGFTEQEPAIQILIDQYAAMLVEAYFYEKRREK